MRNREYQNTLKRIRTNCKNQNSKELAYINKISHNKCALYSKDWPESIELEIEILATMIQVGYLRFYNNKNINSLIEDETEVVVMNFNFLNKKFNRYGLMWFLPRIAFTGGILTIILSIIYYLLDTNTSGFIRYSRTGNSSGNYDLNWFHLLTIGIFLLITSLFFIYLAKIDKKDRYL